MVLECKLKNNNHITVLLERVNIDESLESLLLEELDIKKGMLIFNSDSADNLGYNEIGFKNPPVEIRFIDKKIEIVALNYKGMHIMEFLFNQISSKFSFFTLERKKHKISFIFPIEIQDDYKEKNKIAREILAYINSLITLEECPFFSLYGVVENQIPIYRGKIESKFELNDHMYNMIAYIPDEIYICNSLTKEVVRISYEIKLKEVCHIDIPMYIEDYSLPEVISKQDLVTKAVYKSSNIFNTLLNNEKIDGCFIINTGRGVITGTSDYTYLNTFSLKRT